MLKIKDDVDLKVLEKYGFKLEKDYDECGEIKYYFAGNNLYVFEEKNGDFNRLLDNTDFGFSMLDMDIVYDLIQDGLVEKVE